MYIQRFLSNHNILISVALILSFPSSALGKSLFANKSESAEIFDDDDDEDDESSSGTGVTFLILAAFLFGIVVFIFAVIKVYHYCFALERNRYSGDGGVQIVNVTTQQRTYPSDDVIIMRETGGDPSIWDLFNNLPHTPGESDPAPPYPSQERSISKVDGGYSSSVETSQSRIDIMPNIQETELPPPSYYEVAPHYSPSSNPLEIHGASQYQRNNLDSS